MLETAEAYLEAGRLAEAIDAFRLLLSRNPDNSVLRGRVAEAYRRSGNVERAFYHFHKAATICVRRQDLPQAVLMLEAANQVSPNEPDVLYRWAECLERLGRHGELNRVLHQLVAAATAPGDRRRLWALERLVLLESHDVDIGVAHAAALSEAGRHDDAVAAWRRLSPTLGRSRTDWAARVVEAGHRVLARPDLGALLAHVLLANRRPREGLTLLVPFYDEYPAHLEVLPAVIEALEALQAWDRVLPARLALLRAQVKHDARSPALEGVAGLLRAHPTDPVVLESCAATCHAFGLIEEASRLRFQLCQLYERRGQPEARDQVLSILLRDDPFHEQALKLAVAILQAAGRKPEAANLAQRLTELQAKENGRRAAEDLLEDPASAAATLIPFAPDSVSVESTPDPYRDSLLEGDLPDEPPDFIERSALWLSDDDVLSSRTDFGGVSSVASDTLDISATDREHHVWETDPGLGPSPFDDEATIVPFSAEASVATDSELAHPAETSSLNLRLEDSSSAATEPPPLLDSSPTISASRAAPARHAPPSARAARPSPGRTDQLFIDERPTRIDLRPYRARAAAMSKGGGRR